MPIDDVLHDRKAEPRPALLTACRQVHAVKALRQARQMFGGDAGAIVANRELDRLHSAFDRIELSEFDLDLLSALTVFDGILDDVLGHPHQFVPITENPQWLFGSADRDRNGALLRQRSKARQTWVATAFRSTAVVTGR